MSGLRQTIARCLALAGASLLITYLASTLAWPDLQILTTALLIAPIYIFCHVLRALRLFMLLYDGKVGAGAVLRTHLVAAGVSALIPFKLGELYRIAAINHLINNPTRAVMTVWIERAWDIALVAAGLCALLAVDGGWEPFRWFLGAAGLFLAVSFFLFLVLPENLTACKRWLVIRHQGQWAVTALRAVDALHRLLHTASLLWRYRWATMIWLTAWIWAGELLALHLVVKAVPEASGVVTRLVDMLILRSSPWQYFAADMPEPAAKAIQAYHLGTVDVLAVIALLMLAWGACRAWSRRRLPSTPVPAP